MDTFTPYDLTSAFHSAIDTARKTGQVRYVVQTAWGYTIRRELGLALYQAWKVNADGSIADEATDPGIYYLPVRELP
jgi:hypothetical protein